MRKLFALMAAGRLLAALVQALQLILLARDVSVADFGRLLASFTAQTTILGIVGLGIVPFVLREYARGEMAGTVAALRLNLRTTLAGGVLGASLACLFIPDWTLVASVIALGIAVALDKNIEARTAVAIARSSRMAPLISVIGRPIAALTFYLLLTNAGASAVLAFGIGRLVGVAAAVVAVWALVRLPQADAPLQLRELLQRLWPLAASNSIGTLRALDAVVVGLVAGPAATGLYTAASRILSPVSVVATSVSNVLMPHGATLKPREAGRLIRNLTVAAWLGVVLLSPFTLFAERAMMLLFGEEYAPGGGALSWLLVSLPLAAVAPLIATILQAQNLDRYVFVNTALFTPVTLVLAGLGATLWGASGAAASFAVLTGLRATRLAIGARRLRAL
ncbi:lipopolysaccharide biosynthesis protein [Blastococcus sp. SYSU DS0617]